MVCHCLLSLFVMTEGNTPLPFIDTTRLLAHKALEHALQEDTE